MKKMNQGEYIISRLGIFGNVILKEENKLTGFNLQFDGKLKVIKMKVFDADNDFAKKAIKNWLFRNEALKNESGFIDGRYLTNGVMNIVGSENLLSDKKQIKLVKEFLKI